MSHDFEPGHQTQRNKGSEIFGIDRTSIAVGVIFPFIWRTPASGSGAVTSKVTEKITATIAGTGTKV